ncbi:hypothetical protein J6590_091518 [Homalodisca vitripennis]|nr:hypothetical protein J6590_091518 [Homalodisca vitripennis]
MRGHWAALQGLESGGVAVFSRPRLLPRGRSGAGTGAEESRSQRPPLLQWIAHD